MEAAAVPVRAAGGGQAEQAAQGGGREALLAGGILALLARQQLQNGEQFNFPISPFRAGLFIRPGESFCWQYMVCYILV